MTRRNLLPAFGLVAIALVTALVVVIAWSVGGGGEAPTPALRPVVEPGELVWVSFAPHKKPVN